MEKKCASYLPQEAKDVGFISVLKIRGQLGTKLASEKSF
jgi:hypothetical protein